MLGRGEGEGWVRFFSYYYYFKALFLGLGGLEG
jgi:hypothetical protein